MNINHNIALTYIIGTYPSLTTTFIDREITVLRQLGVWLQVVSIRRPSTPLSNNQKDLQQGVTYLLPVRWPAFLTGLIGFAVRRPIRTFGLLFHLITRPHQNLKTRLMTLVHFIEGIYAAQMISQKPGDHLHAHFIDRAATVAMVVGRLLDLPYSVTAHASDIYVNPVMLSEKLSGAHFVATCTDFNRAYLSQFGSKLFNHKLLCIYHGLDITHYSPGPPFRPIRPIILAVGQLKERKGLVHLVEACRLLRERGLDFECRIIGDGPLMANLKAQIYREHLDGSVCLLGALPHEEVIDHYRQATIFSLPAILGSDGDRDGIPNVILEALAMELPVVSTNHSGVPEVVEDGISGLLVPPADPDALAQALARLIADPGLARELGQTGRRIVAERFDPETNALRLLTAFTSLPFLQSR